MHLSPGTHKLVVTLIALSIGALEIFNPFLGLPDGLSGAIAAFLALVNGALTGTRQLPQ